MKSLIAMSGGVDSSVSAFLMKNRGHECVGCTMKLFNKDGSEGCLTSEDIRDAQSVADRLGIPYHVFDFSADFNEKVIDKFVNSYLSGITPNPCIECNRYLKFEKLQEQAKLMGCDYVVTGHYARIEENDGKFYLKKALDENKDQTYFLYSLTQEQLAHTIFPLGELHKTEVREIAEANGFVNARKRDSQDICFVPDGDYAKVIEERCGRKIRCGNFIDTEGNVIGQHKGIIHFTIGQRRGLGIALGKPAFVCGIDPNTDEVTIGEEKDLYRSEVTVHTLNWSLGEPPAEEFRCEVKIRYNRKPQPAAAYVLDNGNVRIVFDEPQKSITPGQAAVMYDGDTVIGGGIQ